MTHHDIPLNGKRVVILADDLYEDLELWYPTLRLREAGAEVIIASPGKADCSSKHGYPVSADIAVEDVRVDEFDGVVIPGGYAPDRLRRHEPVIKLVRQFAESGKLVGFICHGGWVPVSAGVLEGVSCTGFFSIKDDLINAGASFQDKSVVVDRNFVSSRNPDDLPDFCRGLIDVLSGQARDEQSVGSPFGSGRFSRSGR